MMMGMMENEKAGNRNGKGWFGCYLLAPEPYGEESLEDDQHGILGLFFTNDKGCRKHRGLGFSVRKGSGNLCLKDKSVRNSCSRPLKLLRKKSPTFSEALQVHPA